MPCNARRILVIQNYQLPRGRGLILKLVNTFGNYDGKLLHYHARESSRVKIVSKTLPDRAFVVVQKCRKIYGLGCLNHAHARAQVTQPNPLILLHICRSLSYLRTLTLSPMHCLMQFYRSLIQTSQTDKESQELHSADSTQNRFRVGFPPPVPD